MNLGLKKFRELYLKVLRDPSTIKKYSNVVSRFRKERDEVRKDYADNAESLRDSASKIRDEVVANLPELIEEFTKNCENNGSEVIFATDAQEAVANVVHLVKWHKAKLVIKAKSMMTEEIDLNHFLEREGMNVFETDLGEFIIQLANEKPAHIIAPALHKDRVEVAKLFQEKLASKYTENIEELTLIARDYLREIYKNAHVGITGANFLVADTGSACIVTNEGNARMCTTLPDIVITVAGVDKLIPKFSDLAVFQPLLMRFATGQRFTSYFQILSGNKQISDEAEIPKKHYVILVDNGRLKIQQNQEFNEILKCIRCGACLSVCPVYENIGGHSYSSVYPGPFGSILTPLLKEDNLSNELPHCSTLCMRCDEVCPARINLSDLLLKHRNRKVTQKSWQMKIGMFFFSYLVRSRMVFKLVFRLARIFGRLFGKGTKMTRLPLMAGNWTKTRDFPKPKKFKADKL